jgi:hypothetical protein
MTDDISVDGATVRVGDKTIVLQGDGGEPLSLDHVGNEDGYAAYDVDGDSVTLQFVEPKTDGGRTFDEVTVKPQVRELKMAVNRDHTVRFTFPEMEVRIEGEPDGAEWDPDDDAPGQFREFSLDAETVATLVQDDGAHELDVGGATLTFTAVEKEGA